ncbi:hypothetical protein LOC68_24170 [Blastopirellula sp. JC732]|uniref:Uncharacterized protein n=1 Tax=Blastopirellula sediminis TaxID=2894196 RepID=A0A9X1MTW6_9BACT|nr:hypothetical protein [Blastopirellula sediminis]MCC9605196.1 hypothetical protein [Blastopirellula sediminis]MCC9631504.1 hypothetical protein [Blastopirellula sediminis]
MRFAWDAMTLLAQQQQASFRNMGDRFRAETVTIDYGQLSLLAAFVLFAIVGLWYLQKRSSNQGDEGTDSPRRLFFDLCRVHELNREESKILWQVPRYLNLADPASLFADPTHLVRAVRDAENDDYRHRLENLGVRLFGTLMFRRHLTHCPH